MPQKKGCIPWNKGKKEVQKAWNKDLKTGPLSQIHRQNIGTGNKGKTLGTKNYAWKGDKVSYRSLHLWIYYHKGHPSTCEHCKKTSLKAQEIHWASLSGEYKRDLNDWIRLCVKCHRKLDKNRKTIKKFYDKEKHRKLST
jgi:hypothetical protein